MTNTARMMWVFLVALINLGLGFAVAVNAGRGPWSRYARRSAANHSTLVAPSPNVAESTEQIARMLEGLEHRFQELLQRFSEEPSGPMSLEELQSVIRNMATQLEALGTDETPERHAQASAGLRNLLVVLQAATTELGGMIESNKTGSVDPVPLLTSLQSACREVNMVFSALMFAELPN